MYANRGRCRCRRSTLWIKNCKNIPAFGGCPLDCRWCHLRQSDRISGSPRTAGHPLFRPLVKGERGLVYHALASARKWGIVIGISVVGRYGRQSVCAPQANALEQMLYLHWFRKTAGLLKSSLHFSMPLSLQKWSIRMWKMPLLWIYMRERAIVKHATTNKHCIFQLSLLVAGITYFYQNAVVQ